MTVNDIVKAYDKAFLEGEMNSVDLDLYLHQMISQYGIDNYERGYRDGYKDGRSDESDSNGETNGGK